MSGRAHGPHWYLTFIGECPMCGRDAGYRVRVYGKKPTLSQARYVHISDTDAYCGCGEEHPLLR